MWYADDDVDTSGNETFDPEWEKFLAEFPSSDSSDSPETPAPKPEPRRRRWGRRQPSQRRWGNK